MNHIDTVFFYFKIQLKPQYAGWAVLQAYPFLMPPCAEEFYTNPVGADGSF